MASKKRLDVLLFEKGLASSRRKAQALIMAGRVLVDNRPNDKPGAAVSEDALITINYDEAAFVSRGGVKLQAALRELDLDVHGQICLDVGASTGGFTDCLLQHGALKVYAVDVGYGQLAWQLRQDPRVVAIERTNIRFMPPELVPEPVSLITVDASFISLRLVVPSVRRFLAPNGRILALIKPQFEVGKGKVGKGGVVRSAQDHAAVIRELIDFFSLQGFACGPVVPSPILGPKGNQEFMLLLSVVDSGL